RATHCTAGPVAPSGENVVALAEPVLKHRMALTFAARAEGATRSAVINRLARALGSKSGGGSSLRSAKSKLGLGQYLRPRRRGPRASGPPAGVDAGSVARRQHRGARHSRPPPRRHRRNLLAVPAVPGERPRHGDRLAAFGKLRPPLRARARMGG